MHSQLKDPAVKGDSKNQIRVPDPVVVYLDMDPTCHKNRYRISMRFVFRMWILIFLKGRIRSMRTQIRNPPPRLEDNASAVDGTSIRW